MDLLGNDRPLGVCNDPASAGALTSGYPSSRSPNERGRESWTGYAKASEIRADSIVELTAEPPGTLPERLENESMGTRKSVLQHWQDHYKRHEAGHCPEGPLRHFAERRLAPVGVVG